MFIKLIPNKAARTLTIIDTGIGLKKADLFNNFGATDFVIEDQSGVDFNAARCIANRVTVASTHNDGQKIVWDSSANPEFLKNTDNCQPLGCGTTIVLYIKEDKMEYLDDEKIKEIVTKHSKGVRYPIQIIENVKVTKTIAFDFLQLS